MNQAASATRRSPAGSAANAGCCPMFNSPFFVNTFTPQTPLLPPPGAQPCFLGAQGLQHAQLSTSHRSQQQNVELTTQQSVSQSGQTLSQQQQQQQQQQHQQQQPPPQQQDHSNAYNTSMTHPNLSLQHLFTGRPSPTSCMALAAALAASATFPHFQHQQLSTQNHQQPPINQAALATNTTNPAPTNVTNQVPLLNFNSYSSAPPSLNLSALAAPPAAAHLNSTTSIHHQQQHNSITSAIQASTTNSVSPNTLQNTADQQGDQQQRPVLNNSVNQQPGQLFRNVQHIAPQPQTQISPVQQLGQVTRNILGDETLNNLFNDQFQAILLNQLFSSQQFAPSLAAQAQQTQAQQASSAVPISASRPQQLPSTGQVSVVLQSAQQNAPQIIPQQSSEPVSDNQQAFQSQTTSQTRTATVPPVSTINSASGLFQPQQPNAQTNQQNQATQNSVSLQAQQLQQTLLQSQGSQPHTVPQPQQQTQQQQPQQQQPQSSLPPMPFYTYPQMEQAIALLTNPQVANNIFSHVFNIYLQSGLRSEPHHTHHHHHPPHHFHHHLHGGQHHHHHHGPNGQANGHDATLPLDSLAISEAKPRGLNRAEIDSLTPYIHMNEKETKTCVICLSKFELKSKIRPLPCNHAFHAKCVDKWLRANRTCPICRRDALKTYNAKIKRI